MSIYLSSRHKPSKGCAVNSGRPRLEHGYLKKRGDDWWLLATDSYIAVAVKVTEDGDGLQEGYVPIQVLKQMERNSKHLKFEQLSETAWQVRDSRAGTHTTIDVPGLKQEKYPDFEQLGVWSEVKASDTSSPFGVNAEFTARAGAALGGGVRVEVEGPLKPLRLRPLNGSDDARALLMPIRLLDAVEEPASKRKAA